MSIALCTDTLKWRISGQHGQMIWSNKLVLGIGELLVQSSGFQSEDLCQNCGHPLSCFANACMFYAAIKKGTKDCVRVTVCPPPAPGTAVVSQRYSGWGTACEPTLLINHFAFCSVIFKLDEFPNPAHQAAAQTLSVAEQRGRSKSAVGGWERNRELHQLALLFKGVLHSEANQPLNFNSSLDITTCWLASSAQACGNLDLGMSIMAKEEKFLQLLQSWVHPWSFEGRKSYACHAAISAPWLSLPWADKGTETGKEADFLKDPELKSLIC